MYYEYEFDDYAASTEPVDDEEPQVIQQFFDKVEHSTTMLNGFAKLYEMAMLTDVILCAEGKEFPIHQNVLAVSSPYFMAMFTNDMAEKNQEKITLRSIDSQTLKLVLDYIYNGTVELSEDTVQELLSAANMFQLMSLKTGCASFMINHVDIKNCIRVYFFALAHDCISLANVAKDIINQQFSTLCHENEFLTLPADKVVEIINDTGLRISQEEVVYEACMAWLKHDFSKRIGSLDDILNHVRFANISPRYFYDKIDSDLCLLSDKNAQMILRNVRQYYIQKNRHLELGRNLMPRSGMDFKRCILIIANVEPDPQNGTDGVMDIVLPKTGAVRQVCSSPQRVIFPGCAVTGDNQIYVAGGEEDGIVRELYDDDYGYPEQSGNVAVFSPDGATKAKIFPRSRYDFDIVDPVDATWVDKAKMVPRSRFGLTIIDGYMYAIGGIGRRNTILNSVEQYNIQSNVWTEVASLPQPLYLLSSVAFRGKLYVFGGLNAVKKESASAMVYRYCPQSNEWTELPPMATRRFSHGTVVHKNKIYVIGGYQCTSVEIFDPETETWSAGPELPYEIEGVGCVIYDGKLVTFFNPSKVTYWLQEKDGQDVWMEGEELSKTMREFVCVVANFNPKDIPEYWPEEFNTADFPTSYYLLPPSLELTPSHFLPPLRHPPNVQGSH